MTHEQKQQILDNAPEGATHFSPETLLYYRYECGCLYYRLDDSIEWYQSRKTGVAKTLITLNSLREPEQPELKQPSAQEKRERILRLALEYISGDVGDSHDDWQIIVNDHIDTAKKALAHAASIPDENWSEEDEKRQTLVDQNGNTAEHYEELEEYIVIQNSIDSGPFNKEKAHALAQKWAETTPGKPAAVCHVLAVYQGKVEVDRVK